MGEGGICANEFVRDGEVWKIKALRYFPFWHGSFEEGWPKTRIDFIPMAKTLYPADPLRARRADSATTAALAGD